MHNTTALPPGPPLPRIAQTLLWAARPLRFMEECARRYGDAFTLHFPGLPPEVLMSHPDAIKEIFTGDPKVFRAGAANAPFLRPLMGDLSLLLLDGQEHLRERKLMLPPFHGERMQAYGETMQSIARAHITRWPMGQTFHIHHEFQAITFDIILRTVFGFDGEGTHADLRSKLLEIIRIGAHPAALLPWLHRDLGPLTPWPKLMRLKAEVDDLLLREIARRRSDGAPGKNDIVSLLIDARYEDGTSLTDKQLRDEMITLLVAGHETTATVLAWCMVHLLADPIAFGKVREEVCNTRGEDVQRLSYLDAVIKETMRLTPVIPAVGRVLQEPTRIGDLELPANIEVAPCIYLTHRRPDIWTEPLSFKPERFIGFKPTPYEYLPFGGGVRRCIGMAFALYEMKLVLATLLSEVELSLKPGYRAHAVQRSITFMPSGGVPVIAKRRVTASRARAPRVPEGSNRQPAPSPPQ